jgi:hypothetical protein
MRASEMKRAILPLALVVAACGGNSNDAGTSASEDDLTATAPTPYVLQYVGRYERSADGDVDSVFLKRDGTFTATIATTAKHGVFVGPREAKDPLVVSLVMHGDYVRGTVRANWEEMRYEIDVDHYGRKTTLYSAFPAGGEDMCDDSGGAWTDDDPDPATGLYCVCPEAQAFIPSLGGCVR